MNKSKITCFSCRTLEGEIKRLVDKGVFDFDIYMVEDLFLHDPFDSNRCMEGVFKTLKSNHYQPIVVCTDEYKNLSRICSEQSIPRLGGSCCASIILGEDVYESLRNKGSMFLLPQILQGSLDRLIDEIDGMRKAYKADNLIYLDTGIMRVPMDFLSQLSYEISIPFEVRHTSLDNLFLRLDELATRGHVSVA